VAALTEHHLVVGGRAVTLLEGSAGWGEVSLLPDYSCDPASARLAAEEAAVDGWPRACRDAVACNALVTGPEVDAAGLVGFETVKVKMRTPGDVALVAAVRTAVGPSVAVRVDANGAWDVDTAVGVIVKLRALDIELVEQPCATLEELARVRALVDIPIAADECVRSLDDARRLRSLDAADAVVLKVQPLGGVRRALEIAETSGVPAIPTSMMETSVGIAAGLALAAALPELPYACGLATALLLTADVTRTPLVPEHGVLRVRAVEPDADLLARYAAPVATQVSASSSLTQDAITSATSRGRSR
jgi:O-succinylbenzoate synthase